jgi:WS/DGAT/MGAT family acyltransferase
MHHIVLAAPHDQAALRALVSDIASTPLDHAQPLWQVFVVDEVQGGSALVMRCHHCMADGTALMTIGQKLFDKTPLDTHRPGAAASPTAAAPLSATERASRDASGWVDTVLNAATHPLQTMEKAAVLVSGAGMLVGELLKNDDPQSPLKGEFAPRKLVAWTKPVAIKDVKTIGASYSAKVNDVLIAAMTGALRHYLLLRGVKVNHTTLRAMVPVDLRPASHRGQLGNEFGLVILELAVNQSRASQRLATTKARMDALKRSPEAAATLALFDILGRVPKGLDDFANDLFGSKASLVITNVVGAQDVLYLAGVPIDSMLGWAPHPGKQLGMAITIMSYKGMVTLTVITDAGLIPDPQVITDQFNIEFQSMLKPHIKRASRSR